MITINKGKLPIKVWAEESDLAGYDNALEQAINLSNHPIARKWIALMPDFHVGYGMPIGGVLAAAGGVVPNAVGVDIGCGMIAARTNLSASQLSNKKLEELRLKIHQLVPVGFKHHPEAQQHPFLEQSIDDPIINSQKAAIACQIGTLGGGNHFIEIQADEQQKIWIMVHSGSRNLGKKVADYYHKKSLELSGSDQQLPTPELAYLPDSAAEYSMYMAAMNYCLDFAVASKELMLQRVKLAFAACGIPIKAEEPIETHHNFAAVETHYGDELLVHRKGAVKAEGLVIVPGSMGTASYICEGLQPAESFNTCSHGAGRLISRHEANRRFSHQEAVQAMQHVVFRVRHGQYDELPMAYKDIDRIIKLQSELIKPVHKLLPLAVVKG